jgi:hypothetical protein
MGSRHNQRMMAFCFVLVDTVDALLANDRCDLCVIKRFMQRIKFILFTPLKRLSTKTNVLMNIKCLIDILLVKKIVLAVIFDTIDQFFRPKTVQTSNRCHQITACYPNQKMPMPSKKLFNIHVLRYLNHNQKSHKVTKIPTSGKNKDKTAILASNL